MSVLALVLGFATPSLPQTNITFRYFFDDVRRLIKVVDSSGNVITYSYDAVGNITQITRTTLSGPGALAIFNFTPQRGPVGTTVTIQGQGFSATAANDAVFFNGKAATVTSATATQLVVTVPAGATTGPISATVGGVTAQGGTFTVTGLVSIAVTPANPVLLLGQTVQFTATGTFSDGSTQNVTSSVSWSSSNPSVATISNISGSQGLATSVAVGTTTITALSGSITASTVLTVGPPGPIAIAVTPANLAISLGVKVQFAAPGVLSNGTTQDLTTSATWTSSNTAVATISNAAGTKGLATSVGTGATTITATVGNLSASTTLTVLPAPPAPGSVPHFAYVLNNDQTISIFSANAFTGQLRANSFVNSLVGMNPQSVAVDPFNRFVYVTILGPLGASSLQGDVAGFKLDPNTGALTPVPGSPFPAGNFPSSATVDPRGRFVYVRNVNDATVSAYSINPATGGLTSVPGSPFAAGSVVPGSGTAGLGPHPVTIDPSGKFAYVATGASNTIAAFKIDPSTGGLTPVPGSEFAVAGEPAAGAVDPTGRFLYAMTELSGTIVGFTIDATSGALTQVPGSPFALGSRPDDVKVDLSGRFVYLLTLGEVFAFVIDPRSGSLTGMLGPFQDGFGPFSLAMDPSGRFLYSCNQLADDVFGYSIDSTTGILTFLGAVRSHGGCASMAISQGSSPVTYTPTFAYAANSADNNVSGYTINSSGPLTPLANSPFGAGRTPASVATDPFGRFAYVVNSGDNSVFAYTINSATGSLTPVAGTPVAAGATPVAVTVDPSGQFVFVANSGSGNVSAYQINSLTGALTSVAGSPFAAGTKPVALTVDPPGRFLVVANSGSNNVSVYQIDPVAGGLTACPCNIPGAGSSPFAVGTNPVAVAADPLGQFLYVANSGSNDMHLFHISPNTGILDLFAPFAVGTNPQSVAVEPTGKFVYVAGGAPGSPGKVSAFSIKRTPPGPISGLSTGTISLTPITGSPFPVGMNPTSVTVDISGKFLYVTNSGDNTISEFSIDPNTGALSPVPAPTSPTGHNPKSVTTTGSIH